MSRIWRREHFKLRKLNVFMKKISDDKLDFGGQKHLGVYDLCIYLLRSSLIH